MLFELGHDPIASKRIMIGKPLRTPLSKRGAAITPRARHCLRAILQVRRKWAINAKMGGPEHSATLQMKHCAMLENLRPEAYNAGQHRAQYFHCPPSQESNPRDHHRYNQNDQQPDHEFSLRSSGRRPNSDSRISQVDGSKTIHSLSQLTGRSVIEVISTKEMSNLKAESALRSGSRHHSS
jgi:hypothetical protein